VVSGLQNGGVGAGCPRFVVGSTLAIAAGEVHTTWWDALHETVHRVPSGTAHFLEHTLFEGKSGSFDERFHSLGAETSAYTTHVHTMYHFTTTADPLVALPVLLEQVLYPTFCESVIERERRVIARELELLHDDTEWMDHMRFLEAMYPTHPVKRAVIGNASCLQRIDLKHLQAFHEAFYIPSNAALNVVGSVNHDELLAAINMYFSANTTRVSHALPIAVEETISAGLALYQSNYRLQLGLRLKPLATHLEVLRGVLAEVTLAAIFGESSSLYLKLYKENLVESAIDTAFNVGPGFVFVEISVCTYHPSAVAARIKQEFRRRRTRGVPRAAFERARRAFLGRLLMSLEDEEVLSFGLAGSALRNLRFESAFEILASLNVSAADAWLRNVVDSSEVSWSDSAPGLHSTP
jgi:predicted Zn-dependent peptidase